MPLCYLNHNRLFVSCSPYPFYSLFYLYTHHLSNTAYCEYSWHNLTMAIQYSIRRTLLTVFLLTGIYPVSVNAATDDLADDRTIILGVLDNDEQVDSRATVFTETDIISVGTGGSVIALRASGSRALFYRFKVTETSLIEILEALVLTIQPDEITIPGQPAKINELVIKDDLAETISISLEANNTTLEQTLDLAAIASGYNIYLEDLQIILDRCQ